MKETHDRLLTPAEVAAMFRVDPKTVTRWAVAGRIGSVRTPGGHHRFRESELRHILHDQTPPASVPSSDDTSTSMSIQLQQPDTASV